MADAANKSVSQSLFSALDWLCSNKQNQFWKLCIQFAAGLIATWGVFALLGWAVSISWLMITIIVLVALAAMGFTKSPIVFVLVGGLLFGLYAVADKVFSPIAGGLGFAVLTWWMWPIMLVALYVLWRRGNKPEATRATL